MKSSRRRIFAFGRTAIVLLLILSTSHLFAYSVLTHEEIVDLLWLDEIRPLLLKKYPGLTEEQIKQAHAYAYGGAVIQDLGYYPFGSVEFSDLVHFVRSGDLTAGGVMHAVTSAAQIQDNADTAYEMESAALRALDLAATL